MPATIVWFRRDLRLGDNPALQAAIERRAPIVPLFIWTPAEESPWEPRAASRWWLHGSLEALDESLRQRGSELVVRVGNSEDELQAVIAATGADAVFWNRLYEPALRRRDERIKSNLRDAGLDARSFNGNLLMEPWDAETKQGKPYQVFTPFWKSWSGEFEPQAGFRAPTNISAPPKRPAGVSIDALRLLPKIDWAAGFRATWQPGERGAVDQLQRFLQAGLGRYDEDRNRPDIAGSSKLSPHLHFGEISPHRLWREVRSATNGRELILPSSECFLRELGWREFAHHLLYHFPQTTDAPLRENFQSFPWSRNAGWLKAWQRGRTGYPLVDAGMRELWHTGWMHNRVRMLVASFLTKHLRINWREGAKWFWDTLVDADLAANTLGWQWTAGCGADAAPYFRIFNPTSQAEKFDPAGDYIRRWVPELSKLFDKVLREPWNASADELRRANVFLGTTYPRPIVDHREARAAALAAFETIKG